MSQKPRNLISNNPETNANPVKGITHIENITLITLEGSGMIGVAGSSKRLFEVLSKENINVFLLLKLLQNILFVLEF